MISFIIDVVVGFAVTVTVGLFIIMALTGLTK